MNTYTQQELDISNKSYTNKDFEAIYLELLETAEKISKRFSPTQANEADPFIVLLKLIASVADKVNYNVDKNILERFILSCTQESSMRELTSMFGYSMKYYQSAETGVIFKHSFNEVDQDITEIIIPAFSILTDGDAIQYITTEATRISRETKTSPEVSAIQGKLKDLNILGSSQIRLENLSADRRLYIPESMVAENGISVTSSENPKAWKSWQASDNLNAEVYGSLVYKFGFDSIKGLPYLEFPQWISNVIGNGISVKYLITDGSAGNIAARRLKTVVRTDPPDDGIDDSDIQVVNLLSASSGAEPESISDAHKNYKRLIGTFDTLVTCRDYANKIYELLDLYGNPCVSNVQVGDKRIDINYACDVLGMTSFGSQIFSSISPICQEIISDINNLDIDNLSLNSIYYLADKQKYVKCVKCLDNKGDEDEVRSLIPIQITDIPYPISPYELCLYPLSPITNTSSLAINDANGYNNSYTILNNASSLNYLKTALEQYKTMSHIYKNLKSSDIGYIQTAYKIEATINTIKKVSELEQVEILTNVNDALIAKYNPRTLKFGCEIAFDELLETIEQSDPRIKSVSLPEPEQTLKIVLMNNSSEELYSNTDGAASDHFKFIVSKNILAGRVEAFKYDTDFRYDFAQKEARKYTDVLNVSTYCNISPFNAENKHTYKLNSNEAIQLIAPILSTDSVYPYGINYYIKFGKQISDLDFYVRKNTEYKLQKDDLFVFSYMNNNDELVIDRYDGNSLGSNYIFKPNFDLYSSKYKSETQGLTPTYDGLTGNIDYPAGIYKFYTLSANQTIESRKFSSIKIDMFKKCYWLTNNLDNALNWKKSVDEGGIETYSYILNDGEYFFLADPALTSLTSYGAGTRLKITCKTSQGRDEMSQITWTHNNYVKVEEITNKGLTALSDYFIGQSFDNSNIYLEIFENELITLTTGDLIEVDNTGGSDPFKIENNDFVPIPEKVHIRYAFEGVAENDELEYLSLPDRSTLAVSSIDAGWQIRALLDLNVGPNKPQVLEGNQEIHFVQGIYNKTHSKYLGYDKILTDMDASDVSNVIENNTIVLKRGAEANSNVTFESNIPITKSGGTNISLQYLDLDLTYKCPSILRFENAYDLKLKKSGTEFYVPIFESLQQSEDQLLKTVTATCPIYTSATDFIRISRAKKKDEDLNEVDWNEVDYYLDNIIYERGDLEYQKVQILDDGTRAWKPVQKVTPKHRIFMIYIQESQDSLNTTDTIFTINPAIELGEKPLLRHYNQTSEWSNAINLSNGLNIIEVRDIVELGSDATLCEKLVLQVSAKAKNTDVSYVDLENALSNTTCIMGALKVIDGVNPLLGLSDSDDIIEYMREHFPQQFREFYSCADLDQGIAIELSEDYKLNSAQAFYDPNNVANKWVMCKIDFAECNIRIARNSKK